MLVDTGAAVNIMPYSVLRKLGHSVGDLIKTNITLSDFNGQTSEAQGVLGVDLTVGGKTVPTLFFVVNSKGSYTVLLGRDWIHANCCIPSTMHQCLIQWDGDEVQVVHADDSVEVSHAAMSVWDAEDQEPISGISLEGCDRVEATKKWGEGGLIHWPYGVDWKGTGKADPCDRPPKNKIELFLLSLLHCYNGRKEACSSSRPCNCKIIRINAKK
jgi:hypothetical protein